MWVSRLTRIIKASNERGLPMRTRQDSTVALRPAHDDEASLVRRLAQLDDSRPLDGDVLLAVVDGQPVAALSLCDGRVVADPFQRTAEAVALLELRGSQLSPARARRGRGAHQTPLSTIRASLAAKRTMYGRLATTPSDRPAPVK
jgi:hypothetical protein